MSNTQVNPIFSTILATMSGGPVVTPDVAVMVDELGSLNSQITVLTKRADTLKADIKAQGPERYNGQLYSALVYESEGRTTTDWRAIAEKFNPSRQLITAHTVTGEVSKSIKVTKI